MKNLSLFTVHCSLFTILCSSFILPLLPPSPSTLAQGKEVIDFYCGRTQNDQPATIVRIHGKSREISIIVWKDLKGVTARKRCETVSNRFQTAWNQGNFNYLRAGTDERNGTGLICATREADRICDRNHVLLSLSNARQSQETIERLQGLLSGAIGGPIHQSSGGTASIDMQDLIKALSISAQS